MLNLRPWQMEALRRFGETEQENFLMVATPGAGKTIFAAAVAREMLDRKTISRVVIVVPSNHLREQWAAKFDGAGIEIQPAWTNATAVWPRDFHGVSVTYAQVASSPLLFRKVTADARTLVILDEVHHCGKNRTFGDAILRGFEPAAVRLLLSGTPFREDGDPIPFVRYVDGQAVPDAQYGYDEAIRDGVCRPVYFPAFGGRMEWVGPGGEVTSATFDDDVDEQDQSRRIRTALAPSGNWIREVIRQAHAQLEEYRAEDADAAGLIVTMDQAHAPAVAELVRQVTGQAPVVAISDDDEASKKIATFGKSRAPWIVAVKMISEGVDIPRLRVCVYATNVVRPLTFRQIVGRVVRMEDDGPDQTGAVFIPDDPRLRKMAETIKEQRDAALAEETEELLSGKSREGVERSESFFSPLGSEAEQRGAVFDGSHFSAEEIAEARAAKLRVPGMGGVDDVQIAHLVRLLGKGRSAFRLDATPEAPKRDRVARLRTQGTRYARMIVQRHLSSLRSDEAHRNVNAALNAAIGVRAIGQATEEDLKRRLEFARSWLESGKSPRG